MYVEQKKVANRVVSSLGSVLWENEFEATIDRSTDKAFFGGLHVLSRFMTF